MRTGVSNSLTGSVSWSRCNCDPVEVAAKTSNTAEEFCIVVTSPPRAVLGCFESLTRCRDQQRTLSSQTDAVGRRYYSGMDCVANPEEFACLTWQANEGAYKLWCYASMDDCAAQALGECAWVSRDGSTKQVR
jgi:hypothetical protein